MSESEIGDSALRALDGFQIEIPSWGFANTGTRFGKFLQAGGGDQPGGEVCRCRPGPCADRRHSAACPACALGPARRDRRRSEGPAPGGAIWRPRRVHQSESLSESGVQVRLDLQSGRFDPAHGDRSPGGIGAHRAGIEVHGRLAVDCGWVELSRLAEHPQAHRVARRSAGGNPRRTGRQGSGC